MEIDETSRRHGDFPIDQPLQALMDDHALARRLCERYFHPEDDADKRAAGTHILQLLQMQAALEMQLLVRHAQKPVAPGLRV